jgi:cytochrome b subunit of formate dehydrogenase
MSADLRQITWMRAQWKRFRRILWGCSGAAWLFCCAGILFVGQKQLPILIALAFMFLIVTGVFIYFFYVSRRESKNLERQAIAIRTALAEEKPAK